MPSRSARALALGLALTLSTAPMAATKKKPAGPPPPPSACQDLYANANAQWLREHPLPPGAAGYSRWDEVKAVADAQTRALLADPTPGAGGPAARLLSDLIASSQDTAAIEAAGVRALQPLLTQVAAIRKGSDAANVVAALHAQGLPVLFRFDIERDAGTGQPRPRFRAGGLGLQDPAFYTSGAAELQPVRGLYRAYLTGLLRAAGYPEAEASAQADLALAMETSLASAATQNAALQSLAVKDAGKAYRNLKVADFLRLQGLAATQVEFADPAFFVLADQQLGRAPAAQWQAYLRTQVLQAFAPHLGSGIRQAYDRLFNGVLAGNTALLNPGERLALLVNVEAPELLSAAYAERYPGAPAVARAEAIAESVRGTFDQALSRAQWLAPETREAARKQLAAMRLSIGKPLPVSFAGLGFDRTDYVGNVLALRRWRHAHSMARLATPVWPEPVSQTQPLVGFETDENRLIVTAAALQAPLLTGTDAADYGAFGALVAQQMAQDLRRLTGADAQAYEAKTRPLLDQYGKAPGGAYGADAMRFLPQSATDVGGVDLAYQALAAHAAPTPTDTQAFFRAWAALWARQGSEPMAAAEAMAYPPAAWRANAPAVNHPAFAPAFACKAGQAMAPAAATQVALWR